MIVDLQKTTTKNGCPFGKCQVDKKGNNCQRFVDQVGHDFVIHHCPNLNGQPRLTKVKHKYHCKMSLLSTDPFWSTRLQL